MMTKEELYYELVGVSGFEKCLDAFFESNVVTPRGENRHRDADVLHEWIEGVKIEGCIPNTNAWDYVPFISDDWKYRIKPKEPVCEYLWLDLRTPDDFYCPTNKYMTELEAEAYFRPSHTWFKVLETKRIRE
jgi:hypothetical protein